MIEPEAIPLFTGDLAQLEQHTDALRDESDGIRQAGGEAHRQFQGLSAFYQAPEAEDLFASTAPARDAADRFGDKLATVADALRTYAAEVAPIAKRLERLRGQAATFVAGLKTGTGEFDENWTKDADKVDEHRVLLHDVNAAQAEFAAAEIACNNKITALVGGTQYVLNTGAKQFAPLGARLYGYSTEVLDHAKELPWGAPETERHDWWDPRDFNYYFKSLVWDGLIVDNIWGTLNGLYSMVGINGQQEFEDSWEGLTRMVVGAETYLMEAGSQEPTGIFATDFAQDSKVYAKEFAKSLVAWDMWDENPARASATVLFNLVTLGAGPLKVASAGKAGTTAKVAATVAKVGDAIDPISAAVKVTGEAAPRIAAVTERLRGTNHIPEVRTSTSVLEFSDATGRTVLVVEDGRLIIKKNGEIVTGAPMQEPSVTVKTVPERLHTREREPAGVTASDTVPAGGHVSPWASHEATPDTAGGSDSVEYGNSAPPSAHQAEPKHGGQPIGSSGVSGSDTATGHSEAGVGHDSSYRADGLGSSGEGMSGTPGERPNEPLPALTPEQRAAHWGHLEEAAEHSPEDFDHLQRDPDKNGGISEPSKDEARVGLDLRDQGRLPADIRRPDGADGGEFVSPSTGRSYDIKGVHSDWPPFNNVRDKSRPFQGAYNPATNGKWVSKLQEQIVAKRRIVIIDVRNANQVAIDDVVAIVKANGWEDDVIWYP
ncbi:hypothetical protein ACFWR9_32025 [Streptomyces sp. NPDC058534]|uniref:hypothetical protein n=1 Tax=Streptomyces sp. NPDC058534 TaxID=3346541 RepID=UPI0036527BA5